MRNQRLHRLSQAKLYLCTDARRERGDFSGFVEQVLANGVDIIQLRDKGSPGEKLFGPLEPTQELDLLGELSHMAIQYGTLVAVNDRADIAYAAQADILHLGQHDLPIPIARHIVGSDILIGHSTHTHNQLDQALKKEIDYFCVGPCWSTPTKPGRPPTGLDLITQAHHDAPGRPWFAIGGITPKRLPQVLDAGAKRIVVVRAITQAPDPGRATRYLRDHLT